MITIKEVKSKADLKRFCRFNYELYKKNKYAVPELYEDTVDTLSDKNAAREFCDTILYIAVDDLDRIVGRIAGIINYKANARWDLKVVRFGWVDFIDDKAVSRALIDAVAAWGKSKGMTHIQGPLGFTDMDPEGCLIEGFEELSTMATIYNYPYYKEHFEALGFEKEADWVEFSIKVPAGVPERMARISDIVMKKYNLHIAPRCSTKKYLDMYGRDFFNLINKAFSPLFGYSELSKRQIDAYLSMYSLVLDPRYICMVLDANERLIGAGVAVPSMSEALQKAKGKLLPFGWWHLLKALKWKHPKILDLMLVAVDPEYQGKGINAVFFADLIPHFIEDGYEMVETNVELEHNNKVQSQWELFERRQHKRRRCFMKEI